MRKDRSDIIARKRPLLWSSLCPFRDFFSSMILSSLGKRLLRSHSKGTESFSSNISNIEGNILGESDDADLEIKCSFIVIEISMIFRSEVHVQLPFCLSFSSFCSCPCLSDYEALKEIRMLREKISSMESVCSVTFIGLFSIY